MKQSNQLAALFAANVWQLQSQGASLRSQIYRQLRDAVIQGRMPPGAVLPSSRDLARALGVSRSTLVEALDQLRVEGYLETQQGAATRIAALNSEQLRRLEPTGSAVAAPTQSRALAHWQQLDPSSPVTLRAFRPGLPDLRAFPAREWATHLARRARQPASHDLSYAAQTGVPSLREQIVRHVADTRHVLARPEQVLVLPSSNAAFDIALRCSVKPGDTAWMEDPGYAGMRALLLAHQSHIVPVAVDTDGMRPSAELPRPKFIYLTPSHQSPTGAMLSLQRRLELLDLAKTSGAVIVEDDFDSEFQIRGQPIASLQGLDRAGCVFYVGTFSKCLAPGLRMAYMIVPPQFVELTHTMASTCGVGVPIHLQLAMADFMADGGLRRHIQRMRSEYAARLDALHGCLLQHGAPHIKPVRPLGGLQLCAGLTPGANDIAVAQGLLTIGIHAAPLSALSHSDEWRNRPGLLLGIGLVKTHEIEPAAVALCQVLPQLMGSGK